MADAHTKEIRSYNMSQTKGRNTNPEMLLRRFLPARGYCYKLHDGLLWRTAFIIFNLLKCVSQ